MSECVLKWQKLWQKPNFCFYLEQTCLLYLHLLYTITQRSKGRQQEVGGVSDQHISMSVLFLRTFSFYVWLLPRRFCNGGCLFFRRGILLEFSGNIDELDHHHLDRGMFWTIVYHCKIFSMCIWSKSQGQKALIIKQPSLLCNVILHNREGCYVMLYLLLCNVILHNIHIAYCRALIKVLTRVLIFFTKSF